MRPNHAMSPDDHAAASATDASSIDDGWEPLTVPRPRAVSGFVVKGEGVVEVGGGWGEVEPDAPVATEVMPAISFDEALLAAAEPSAAAAVEGWSIRDEATGPSTGGDPAKESGIYPIFDDGDAALAWVRSRRAVLQATEEIAVSPADPVRYVMRALAKIELGALREAIDDCTHALSLRPSYVEAYVTRAGLHIDSGNPAEGVADCSRALRIDPDFLPALRKRAAARLALGDLDGAVGDYDEAIMRASHDATLFKDRGEVKARLGDFASALLDLNIAVAMDPTDEDAAFKRILMKILLADSRRGVVDWGKAVAKALAQLEPAQNA